MTFDASNGDYATGDSEKPFLVHPDEVEVHARSGANWSHIIISALIASVLTFAATWAVTSSKSVSVTLVAAKTAIQSSAQASATPAASTNGSSTGQVALTATQLVNQVKASGQTVYWAGEVAGALYTLDRTTTGQYFIRYLPGGQGLSDTQQNYRVIATYQDAKAYATMQIAGKMANAVSFSNPDGSLVYYSKATPTHVYLAYKDLGYQIEIFDPTAGASLKLATTPGVIHVVS